MRAGYFVKQPGGHRAFLPAPLPPKPPISWDAELHLWLSEAGRALGRLEGIEAILPAADVLAGMFARHEASLSCQIKGNPATLEDVVEFEAGRPRAGASAVEEVRAYAEALEKGLRWVEERRLDLKLLRDVHSVLLPHERGRQGRGGEFRRIQNWIGPEGCTLSTATFVPPPVPEMHEALEELEQFLGDSEVQSSFPVVIQCGLVHAQFETIHPFLDGNGRLGRLLIPLFLKDRRLLHRSMLCMSHFLKAHRFEYYEHLSAVRLSGDWERWLKFFLRGVVEVARAAEAIIHSVLELRERHRKLVAERLRGSARGVRLLEQLFERPVTNVRQVQSRLGCAYVTANKLVDRFVDLELLEETTGWRRHRQFRYTPYLSLFEAPPPAEIRSAPG